MKALQIGLTSLIAVSNVNPGAIDSSVGLPVTQKAPVTQERVIEDMITESAKSNGVDTQLALAIAKCESHLRQFDEQGNILRGEDNPKDVGIFQINEKFHLEESKKQGFDIYTAQGNTDYAMTLLKKQGSKPWFWSKGCWRENSVRLAENV